MPVNAKATFCNDILTCNDPQHQEEVGETPRDNLLSDISAAAHLVPCAVIIDLGTKCFGLCESSTDPSELASMQTC